MSWSPHSLTSEEHMFMRQSVEKLRSECKVIHHAHQELPCLIVRCMERRTQHKALVRTVNGRWRSWTTTLVCSIRVLPTSCKDVSILRHGDDFATRTQVADIEKFGPRPQLLDVCELRILSRVIRWVVPPFGKAPERTEIEADPRHS